MIDAYYAWLMDFTSENIATASLWFAGISLMIVVVVVVVGITLDHFDIDSWIVEVADEIGMIFLDDPVLSVGGWVAVSAIAPVIILFVWPWVLGAILLALVVWAVVYCAVVWWRSAVEAKRREREWMD